MSTPPTGEDPQRQPPPDDSAYGRHSGASPFGQPPPLPGYEPPPPGYDQPGAGHPQPPAYAQPGPGPGGQPAYGGPYGQQAPPAWPAAAPPQPAPPDRKRKRLIIALELVALAIAVGVATLVYVLSSTILDRAAVQSAVAAQFEEREGVALDLDCPKRMFVEPGRDYECEGTTADGEEVEIRITITDEDGAYTWGED
jgi:hypothetical protein